MLNVVALSWCDKDSNDNDSDKYAYQEAIE
jgi:hypothetical protein